MAEFQLSVEGDFRNALRAIRQVARGLDARHALMLNLGAAMLVSVRRTFRDEGVPAHSWMPLAPSTIKKDPKKYGPGHKLLISSGRLLNSIGMTVQGSERVLIGTKLRYAAVHQYGSRDRGSIGLGPRTQAQQEATVSVMPHTYDRLAAPLGTGRMRVMDAAGRNRVVRRIIAGPRGQTRVSMAGHERRQNIPARPFLVFRPEDPERLAQVALAYVKKVTRQSGLGG